jgi:hypothetical protein
MAAKAENIIPIQISTNGGEFHTAYCVKEDGLTLPMAPIKQFTLIDKHGQHLVFKKVHSNLV